MGKPVCVNTDEEEAYTGDPKYQGRSKHFSACFGAVAAGGVGVAFVKAPAWKHMGSGR